MNERTCSIVCITMYYASIVARLRIAKVRRKCLNVRSFSVEGGRRYIKRCSISPPLSIIGRQFIHRSAPEADTFSMRNIIHATSNKIYRHDHTSLYYKSRDTPSHDALGEIEIQTDRHTDRQTDSERDRQTDRQTDR